MTLFDQPIDGAPRKSCVKGSAMSADDQIRMQLKILSYMTVILPLLPMADVFSLVKV